MGLNPRARGYGTGLQGMADRLAALGGELRVDSALAGGTTVHGSLPVQALELVRRRSRTAFWPAWSAWQRSRDGTRAGMDQVGSSTRLSSVQDTGDK
jgi:hypothetical protein